MMARHAMSCHVCRGSMAWVRRLQRGGWCLLLKRKMADLMPIVFMMPPSGGDSTDKLCSCVARYEAAAVFRCLRGLRRLSRLPIRPLVDGRQSFEPSRGRGCKELEHNQKDHRPLTSKAEQAKYQNIVHLLNICRALADRLAKSTVRSAHTLPYVINNECGPLRFHSL